MIIYLVGMPGAGKSVVGRELAGLLGVPFIDLDTEIERETGRTVAEIFAAEGEAYFRAAEDEVLRLLALKRGEVIATGGGLPCREGRAEALRALGTVVWLSGDFETLYERALRGGERPVLAGRTRDDVRALYRSREPFYARAAFTVDTTSLGLDQVAARIAGVLRSRDRQAVEGAVQAPSE